jgi:F-type H+-transporting ATPase subunit gamma
MAEDLITGYQEGRYDEFFLVYNYFRSAISQEIRIDRILPLSGAKVENEEYLPEYLYEPSRKEFLEKLVPRALATVIRRAFLESVAGEYGARMVAMENATNNSKDMIHKLTLQMNRLRQAAITKELMDIVNGAESLKKQ